METCHTGKGGSLRLILILRGDARRGLLSTVSRLMSGNICKSREDERASRKMAGRKMKTGALSAPFFCSAVDADKMLSIAGNPQLEIVAKQVNEKLRRVIDSV